MKHFSLMRKHQTCFFKKKHVTKMYMGRPLALKMWVEIFFLSMGFFRIGHGTNQGLDTGVSA